MLGSWPESRRVKVLWFGEQEIINILLFSPEKAADFVTVVDYSGIPKDVKVHRVTHDPMRRGFGVLIEHESFDEVPDGAPAPDFFGPHHWGMKRYEIRHPAGFMVIESGISENGMYRVTYEQVPFNFQPDSDRPTEVVG